VKLVKSSEQFVGQIVFPPELRYTPTGKAVAMLRIETAATQIACEAWQEMAEEIVETDYKAGEWIVITGRLKSRTWNDMDGKTHTGEYIGIERMGHR
jgi:single-stranded DNA-binding protein